MTLTTAVLVVSTPSAQDGAEVRPILGWVTATFANALEILALF